MEFDKSLIFDIAYGYEPMTRSLAVALKELRCGQQLTFETIPPALDPGFSNDFALGKELCLKAKAFLRDTDALWD